MARTEISASQLKDEGVTRADLNISTSGSAVVRKIVAGTSINLGYTGADAGTGDVTINLSSHNHAASDITSGQLAMARGGLGFDASSIAKGGVISGTGSGTAGITAVGTNNYLLVADSTQTGGIKWAAQPVTIMIVVSDETTAITTGTAKVTFRMPFAMTVTAVRASLTTASSSGNPTVDINEGGTSILGTKLSIDSSELTSTTAASAATITDSALADDAQMTIDIDTAGTGAKGLKVYIKGTIA